MKKILVVIDSLTNVKVLMEKSLRFNPEELQILAFDQEIANAVESLLAARNNPLANAEIVVEHITADKHKAQKVVGCCNNFEANGVVIYRPSVREDTNDFAFEKKLLNDLSNVRIVLCGEKDWKSTPLVLSTIDITGDSKEQDQLNDVVRDASINTADSLSAELCFLSVIGISRASEELDLVEPYEVLEKKAEPVKIKLKEYLQNSQIARDYSMKVSAGVPSKEIPSVAKKMSADLVMLGSVGRTGIMGLIVGNTAEKTLNKLTVDVLIVKNV